MDTLKTPGVEISRTTGLYIGYNKENQIMHRMDIGYIQKFKDWWTVYCWRSKYAKPPTVCYEEEYEDVSPA